jgi:putative ABC transport system ATP-binding protein
LLFKENIMAKVLLKAKGLTKIYATDKAEVAALDNLDIEIYNGEYAVIMGPSGSGKTSLLHVLGGLDSLTEGNIFINNAQINIMSEKELAIFRRRNIGYIFQTLNLVPNLSVIENILISGFLLKTKRRAVVNRAYELLKTMGIHDLAHRMPAEVSGGELQRVAIARVLINQPAMILADEPTGNLNSASTNSILNLFTQINRDKQTILMVTHELKAACRGDRVFYIKDGRIDGIYTFPPNTESSRPQREEELFKWLNRRGW